MYHIPVLRKEVTEGLNASPDKNIVDCNLGGGGHAIKLLEQISPDGCLIGIDLDADAIKYAGSTLKEFGERAIIVQDNFSNIEEIVENSGLDHIDGVLFDLGLSTHHLEGSGRGFTFNSDEPLEMSFSHDEPRKAADILNKYQEKDLLKIFREYGELRNAPRLAHKITEVRAETSFELVSQLTKTAQLARLPKFQRNENKYLSQVFQALRIEVNNELEHLRKALEGAVSVLSKGGRIVVISYHSLEDRIVKYFFRDQSVDCVCPSNFPVCVCEAQPRVRIITRKPIVPSDPEIEKNTKSRSAKLRIAEKL